MGLVTYKSGNAYVESVSLKSLGERFGTPLYVYSHKKIKEQCNTLLKSFSKQPTLICYALKANSNLSLLKLIFGQGLGADVVSCGEMKKALQAGVDSNRIVSLVLVNPKMK
ncbi:MAG: hypothetical protein EBQ92_10045 [Proteobacteria bacterium]|nr:hypothetical protein [Pseudomonadota bacterium]